MHYRLPPRVYAALAGTACLGALTLALTFPTDRLIGLMFEAEGKFDRAIDFFREWNVDHPQDYEARWHTAALLLQTVRPEEAIEILEKMKSDWPSDPKILKRLVEIEDSLLRVDRVVPRLEALATLRPDDPEVIQALADHHRWFGESEKLLEDLRHLVTLGDYPDEHHELVEILLANRRYDDLILFFTEAIAQNPTAVEPREALYEAFLRSGRAEQALRQLKKILELEPKKLAHLRNLADQLMEMDRLPEAVDLYEMRLEQAPRNRALNLDLAQLYEEYADRLAKEGRTKEAITIYKKRIKQNPKDLSLRLNLSYFYGRKQVKVAIKELTKLTEIDPENGQAWATLGLYLGWENDLVKAVEAYQKAHELAPEDIDIQRSLAQHLLWSNKESEAISHYAEIVEKGSKQTDRAALVELLIDAEKPKTALPHAKVLVKARPEIERYRMLAARAGLDGDRCDAVLEDLRWLTKKRPRDPWGYGKLGLCARKLGKTQEAMLALIKARSLRRQVRRATE